MHSKSQEALYMVNNENMHVIACGVCTKTHAKRLISDIQTLALSCVKKLMKMICLCLREGEMYSAVFKYIYWPTSPAQSHCTQLQGHFINSKSHIKRSIL